MGRRKKKEDRGLIPDPRYNNILITRFINRLMKQGKKSVAQKVLYDALDIIKEKLDKNPIEIFDKAIKNVSPLLEVRSRRVGGAHYQIPFPVNGDRKQTLAIRWLIMAARTPKGKPMGQRLAKEFMDASRDTGAAVKNKNDVQRMAEANRAFARFAWH